MGVAVSVAPELLVWAVERAGWSWQTAIEKEPRLDGWMEGIDPTLRQLERFADATHVPIGMFFLPEPPIETLPVPDLRTMPQSRSPRPSADLLDVIYDCERKQDWFREYAIARQLDPVREVASASLTQDPKAIAAQMQRSIKFSREQRREFRDSDAALRGLISRAEQRGVLVCVSSMVGSNTHRMLNPEEFRGFALPDSLAPLVFVNAADTRAAKLFTLVHELAHVWLGQGAVSNPSLVIATEDDTERWCNAVAAEFLMPIDEVGREFHGEISINELERLAREFRVSTLVVLRRIRGLGAISWEEYRRRYVDERQRVLELLRSSTGTGHGNYYNTQPLRVGRRFARAVVSDTREGRTTYRDAFRLLGTKSRQVFDKLASRVEAA